MKRYVFYMDGDGQFDIKDLDKLLPLASEDAIVTGFRIERRDPFVRRLNAKLFGGWLVRVMLGVYVKDLNCAFKLIPKKVFDDHHAGVDRRADQRRAVRPRHPRRLRHPRGRRAPLPARSRRADRRPSQRDLPRLLRPLPPAAEDHLDAAEALSRSPAKARRWVRECADARVR